MAGVGSIRHPMMMLRIVVLRRTESHGDLAANAGTLSDHRLVTLPVKKFGANGGGESDLDSTN